MLRTFSSSGARVTLEGYTLFELVAEAYSLKDYQVILSRSVPQSLASGTYYNVVAEAAEDRTPTKAEFREMLQTLLTERCDLRVHREKKEMPVYALVVGRNGPKFKESAPQAASMANQTVNGRNQNLILLKTSMESLADSIEGRFGVDRPVLDKTGLTGTYTIQLEATPEYVINHGDPETGDLSIFTAVQNQLGLKLEPQKGQIEILVIDHIDKPSEN